MTQRYEQLGGTKGKIFHVAIELFAVNGYSATSLRDIAAAVGIQPASLYNHIESKEDLLFKIIKEASRHGVQFIYRALADAERTAEGRLRAATWANTVYHARHPFTARIGLYELHSLSPERFGLAIQMRDEWEAIFKTIVQDGIECGHFRPLAVSPTVTAIIAMGAYTPLWFKPGRGMTPEELGDLYAEFALRSVLADPDK